MKKRLIIILSLVFCLALTAFVSCSKTKSYTVSFVTNCEMQVKKATVGDGKEYTLPQAPDRGDGWEFQGWYADKEFSGSPVTSVKVTKNLTFYAKWEQLYNLTLDLNGGTMDGSTSFYLKEGADVNSVLDGKTPSKAGHEFGAWLNGNSELSANYKMPAENVNLTAKYTVGYTLEVYKQNETLDGYDRQTLTLFDYATADFTVNYTIEGFVLAENDDAVLSGELKENPAQGENVFVAYFNRIKYSIQLNSNYPDATKENTTQTYEWYYGIKYNLRHDVFTCGGYFFVGWTAKDSDGVDYPMDYIDTLLYNSTETYEGIDYYATRDITLYACWMKGYTDLFGGIDTILVFENKPRTVYLARGGKYFKGDYTPSNKEFYFINTSSDKTILEGKLLENNVFCYRNENREGVNAYYYSVKDGLNKKVLIKFGSYNDLEYRITDDKGNTDVSKGTYTILDDSSFAVTFTDGTKKDSTLTFMLNQVSNGNSAVRVFIERNDEEYALGKLVRFAILENKDHNYDINSYNDPYYTLTLSGYGMGVFYNGATAVNCYYVYDEESGAYKLTDTNNKSIGYAKYMNLYDTKGYMFYSSDFNNTFADSNGGTLKLDGVMNAEYNTEDEIVRGYYTLTSSYLGGYLVTIKTDGSVYKFIVNVETEGEGENQTKKYVMETRLPGYTEYGYYLGDQKLYAPILVLDGSKAGEADLYSRASNGTCEKASHGTYQLDESTGLYVYNVTETYSVDGSGNMFDIEKLKAMVFDVAESSYRLYYIYSYTLEDSVEEVLNTTVYTPSKETQSGYKLTLVAGFAILSLDENTTYTAMYESGSNGLKRVSAGGKYIYFETNDENKTFLVYDYAPFTAYVYRENGTASQGETMTFDGKGGVVYTVDKTEYTGTATETEEKYENGGVVMKFKGSDGVKPIEFKFILMSTQQYVFFAILSEKQGEYTNNGKSLLLDGTGFNAVYTDENGVELYKGMYRAYSDNIIYFNLNDEYVFFELDAEKHEFISIGNEIGQYLYVTNGGLNDLRFTLDGKGNLYVSKYNDNKELYPDGVEVIDANGTYEFNDNDEVVFKFNQNGQKTLTGKLSTLKVNSTTYNCFFTNFSDILGIYVNEDDNSVLYLDDIGNAIVFLADGGIEAGSYTLIADEDYTIVYYVNSSGTNATLYNLDSENKLAYYGYSPVMAYYNANLSALQFTKYGFAVFNGESRYYFYVDIDENIAIYHRATTGETNVNKYGFVKDILGKEGAARLTYNNVEYYLSDGFNLIFGRNSETATKYPVAKEKDGEKFPLGSLSFIPSGADEFNVTGTVVIGKNDKGEDDQLTCNVVRKIIKGTDGAEDTVETYILVGNFRFDIKIEYSSDRNSCKYEITRMRYMYDVDSYLYTYYYYMNLQYYGQAYANRVPQVGHIAVWREYDEAGVSSENWTMNGTFYQASGVYDVNGNPIAFENAGCTLSERGYFDVKFTYTDGCVYEGLFQLDDSLGKVTYKMPVFVRVQTFEMENNVVIEVSRNVSADNPKSRIPGDLAALSIKINGEEVSPDAIYKMGDRFAYIVRTKDDNGKILSTTYYYVKFLDENADPEGKIVKPYSGAELDIQTMTTYQSEDGKSYADIDKTGNVLYVKMGNNAYLPESTEHVDGSNVYTVTLKNGKKYKLTITDGVMTYEEVVAEEAAA